MSVAVGPAGREALQVRHQPGVQRTEQPFDIRPPAAAAKRGLQQRPSPDVLLECG